ncbi:ParM/StbA family protein [Butyrivibrio sp. AC2005]|uniref:ParM/StbA family protein n=1 Tax=Butyrivibrio sp. AC2005 TaxID=1280672 RepID=UPI0003FD0864|nr:ParM/StbA family protein [Butyrivibrio sp. AC2005]
MTIKTLAVDSGKYATKACIEGSDGKVNKLKFLTRMDEGKENLGDSESYSVQYEGNRYLLGRQAVTWNPDRSKKSDIHRIATYAAIANLVGNGDQVNVGVGCPLSIYMNPAARKNYKEFLVPHGKQVNITVNRKPTQFTIKRSFVFPESSGMIHMHPEIYGNDTIGVIDIGGLNANCCIYDEMIPKNDVNSMFTLEEGGHVLFARVKAELESACEVSLSDILMDKIMRDGFIHSAPEVSAQIIKRNKRAHVVRIFNECKKNGWPLENMKVVFTGGTSALLKEEIEDVFPWVDLSCLSEEGEFTNAVGFLLGTKKRIF